MKFAKQVSAALALIALSMTAALAQGVWTPRSSGYANILNGMTWTGTQFVAVGMSASWQTTPDTLLTSPDGVTWTRRPTPTKEHLNAVASGGGLVVAVGSTGAIVTSPDGVTWLARASGTTNALTAITWTGSQFVAVGGAGTIVTSPTGITWTVRTTPNSTANLTGIAWSPTAGFVVVGVSGYHLTSPDGITWTRGSDLSGTLNAVVWAGNQFVTVGSSAFVGSLPMPAYTSPDGITWTSRSAGNGSLFGLIWTGSLLVGVGQGGQIMTSSDGITLTTQPSGTTANLNAVAFSGATFATVGGKANGGSTEVTILSSVLGSTGIRDPSKTAVTIPSIAKPIPGSIHGYRANGSKPVPVSIKAPAL